MSITVSRCRYQRDRARDDVGRHDDSGARSALAVQVIAYYSARIPIPDLSHRIADGELGPAIWPRLRLGHERG